MTLFSGCLRAFLYVERHKGSLKTGLCYNPFFSKDKTMANKPKSRANAPQESLISNLNHKRENLKHTSILRGNLLKISIIFLLCASLFNVIMMLKR